MKIKNLWVSKYKNIEDLSLDFTSDLITLLVGKNGLGKSNLIEILALIFRDLDLLTKRDDFENWAYEKEHFEYDITYCCHKSEIRIECKEGSFKIWIRAAKGKGKFVALDFAAFIDRKKSELLPKFIIGYYSGENKRIRDIIRPYEMKAWDELKNNSGHEEGLRRMFFADNIHSQMLLLTLLLYQDSPTEKGISKQINVLFEKYIAIHSIAGLDAELRSPSWFNTNNKEMAERSVFQLEENYIGKNKVEFPFWNAKHKADRMFRFLYENSGNPPTYYEDEIFDEGKKRKIERLTLNSIDVKKAAKNANKAFGHPINFFDALESLEQIGSLQELVVHVRSMNTDVHFNFRQLSEGEQQLLVVLSLILITGREECLFLLDEPDTHLNPEWQRDYVSLLREFNLNDNTNHIFVATHSPLIVQSVDNVDVIVFKKGERGMIYPYIPNRNMDHFRIDQILVSEIFDLKSSRSKELDPFIDKRLAIIRKGKITTKDRQVLEKLKNEMGYLPNGETIEEIENQIIIKSVADLNRKKK